MSSAELAVMEAGKPTSAVDQPRCRFCDSQELFAVLDFGLQPIAQRFVATATEDEYLHGLSLHCCESCGLLQIVDPIDPDLLYQEEQYFVSSSKPQPSILAEADVVKSFSRFGSVLEIGCNDGLFLELLRERGFSTCVGLEPNPHTTKDTVSDKITIHAGYFTDELTDKLKATYGEFEFIVARGVLEHIADIAGYFERSRRLLRPDGYVYFMLPWVEPFLEQGDVTLTLEQHVNYATVPLMRDMLWRYGFEPVSVQEYNYGGGVIGVLGRKVETSQLRTEGASAIAAIKAFPAKVERYREELRRVLARAKAKGYEVFIYGVGWRSCILVNGFQLRDFVEYAVDDRPERQGKFLPGCRLPILPPSRATNGSGPAVCLLAVNQEHEAAVTERLRSATERRVLFASIAVPNDILAELRTLDQAL